jgi:tetratricopeptide (TPR) repeat protein
VRRRSPRMGLLPMSLTRLRGTRALAALLVLLAAQMALAQVEPPRPVEELEQEPRRPPPRKTTPPPPAAPAVQRAPARAAETQETRPVVQATRPLPPPVVPTASDTELLSAFRRWQQAERDGATRVADAARAELLSLRAELGISDLEAMSMAMLRAAGERRKSEDVRGSVELATGAAALSPGVPYVYLGLARAQLAEEPLGWARAATTLRAAGAALWNDPRYARAALGDVGTALLFAWVATAVAFMAVLFLRHALVLFHDVHHLFPRAVARWQSSALVVLALLLPLVFHLGLAVELLVVLAALTLYLSPSERIAALVLLAGLGAIPLAAGKLAQATAFAGTPAEDAYLLERGGLEAAAGAARVRSRATDGHASFGELYALGRYEARRGHLTEASVAFNGAAALRPADARLLTEEGNLAFVAGALDRAAELYARASEADPSLAEAYWNAAKLHRWRSRGMTDDAVGPELDRAQTALATAVRLDERLGQRQDPPDEKPDMNRLLLSPPLPRGELAVLADVSGRAARVRSQAAAALLGGLDASTGAVVPLGAALALLGFGLLRGGRGVSHACDKCGRPVCRRCDPELSVGSPFCPQCVNVFARRGVVPPLLKMNKEMEVRRHRTRNSRIAYTLGLLVSGLGHVFSGSALRGVGYAFLFLFAAASVITREGVLRAPYGPAPEVLRLLPLALLVAAVCFFSLRGLSRKA